MLQCCKADKSVSSIPQIDHPILRCRSAGADRGQLRSWRVRRTLIEPAGPSDQFRLVSTVVFLAIFLPGVFSVAKECSLPSLTVVDPCLTTAIIQRMSSYELLLDRVGSQTHLLNFWNDLSDVEKDSLAKQVALHDYSKLFVLL